MKPMKYIPSDGIMSLDFQSPQINQRFLYWEKIPENAPAHGASTRQVLEIRPASALWLKTNECAFCKKPVSDTPGNWWVSQHEASESRYGLLKMAHAECFAIATLMNKVEVFTVIPQGEFTIRLYPSLLPAGEA